MTVEGEARVSVIVAVRNAERVIARAVASALAQPETLEVIVVDDASSDDTVAAARACDPDGERLRIVALAENLGPAGARNRALGLARGEFVAVLDGDDLMLPGRLGRLMAAASDADLVFDDLSHSHEGRPLQLVDRLIGLDVGAQRALTLEAFARGNISRSGRKRRELGFLKPLIRKSLLERSGLCYDETLRLGEDYVLYASALASGARGKLISACGYVAVERADSLSGAHTTADLAAFHLACEELASRAKSPSERRALKAQAQSVKQRLTHRQMLDAKAERGWSGVCSVILGAPRQAPWVIVQTARDKLEAAKSRTRGGR